VGELGLEGGGPGAGSTPLGYCVTGTRLYLDSGRFLVGMVGDGRLTLALDPGLCSFLLCVRNGAKRGLVLVTVMTGHFGVYFQLLYGTVAKDDRVKGVNLWEGGKGRPRQQIPTQIPSI
jgi:hypothetical protein